MSTPDKFDIFICYSRRNKNWLPKLRNILNDLKEYRYFIDESDIETAQEWDSRIKAAISTSKVAICLASRHFFQSNYIINRELPSIATKLESKEIKVITIRITGCEIYLKGSELEKYEYFNSDDYIDDPDDLDRYSDRLKLKIKKLMLGTEKEANPLQHTHVFLPEKPKWFIGYKAEKDDLKQYILSGKGFISITGDPCTGRRTLAKQVAHELLENGDLPGGAIWIDCQKIGDERALIAAVSEVYLGSHAPANLSDCQRILTDEFSKKRNLIVLVNIENPKIGILETWAKKIKSPSVVIEVTTSFARPEDTVNISLSGLDDEHAKELFIKISSQDRPKTIQFSRQELVIIKAICHETLNNPLLIEKYANSYIKNKLLLADILKDARSNRDSNVIMTWKSELEPLFSSLKKEELFAFLKLCRLPYGVSSELVQEITGFKTDVLGRAIKYLWNLVSEQQRYVIKPSVRIFSAKKLAEYAIRSDEIDKEVVLAFTWVATAKAAQIEQSLGKDRQTLEEAVEWFWLEWENLKHCVDIAERVGDEKTVCQLVDSVLQFMIRRGKHEDCLKLYTKALSIRDRDEPSRAKTLNDMAVCFQFQDNFHEARLRIEESIRIRRELIKRDEYSIEKCELMFRLSQSLNTYGAINNLFGEEVGESGFEDDVLKDSIKAFEDAAQICEQALKIATSDSMQAEIQIECSQTLSNLGRCFTICGRQAIEDEDKKHYFDKAIRAFNDSIAIERPGDEREGQTYSRRGQLWLEKNILPLAERDFNRAINIFESASNIFELGLAHLGRGWVFVKKAGADADIDKAIIDKAISDFQQAEKLFAALHKPKNQFRPLMELAKIEKERGKQAEAIEYATQAYDIALTANLESEQKEVEHFLANLQA